MSGPPNLDKSPACSSLPSDFFLTHIIEDEFNFVTNNMIACKKIINDKKRMCHGSDQVLDLAFWTRLCISTRQHLIEKSGQMYFSEVADQIFIEFLKKLKGGNGGKRVVDYILGTWEILCSAKDDKTTPFEFCHKQLKNVLPPKLVKLAKEGGKKITSCMKAWNERQKFLFALNVSCALSGCLARTLSALITGSGNPIIPNWEMPIAWRSSECRPLELEEYLQDKWGTDFADVVAMVPIEEIGWWGHKQRELKVARTGSLSRVQSFPWKSANKSAALPTYLKAKEPETLFTVLKQRHPTLENQMKEMPADDTLLLFKCYKMSVPPVLATKYHNGKIEGQHCLNLSAWFASWCCVMDHSKLKQSILQNSFGSNAHSNKEHLTVLKDTLANWSCPEAMLQSDEPDKATVFLEMANVRIQFLSNFTIRQQWLAVALSTVLKFELEAAPLQFCPLPDSMVKFAVEILSMIKMTKESILLALKAHEEDNTEDLKVFVEQLMPVVVPYLCLIGESSARDCVQDLISKCPPYLAGTRVPSECWRLDSDLEVFYDRHPWYFAFYKNCSPTVPQKILAKDKADQILKSWRSEKTCNGNFQKPEFKGLVNQEAFNCIISLGWHKEGTFVRNVVGVLAFMGYMPDEEVDRLLEIDLKYDKFEKPFNEILETDYDAMDLIGKISCHCIVLLNSIIKYRADGKLLNSCPKTLVEKLVTQSLELYELEHLHMLLMLAGQLCGFQPKSPLQCEKTHLLIDFIVQLRTVKTRRIILSEVEVTPHISLSHAPVLFDCGTRKCKEWLGDYLTKLQVDYHSTAASLRSKRNYAVLLQYLFPCYLTLMDDSRLDVNGAQFLFHVLACIMSTDNLDECLKKFKNNKDITYSRIAAKHYQNQILQLVNAFIDYGFKGSAEVLAEMFSKMNWCLEPSTHSNQDLLNSCILNFNLVLHHLSEFNQSCLMHIVNSSRFLAQQDSPQRLRLQILQLYCHHIGTHFMTAMESESDFEDEQFQQALGHLTLSENRAHWWRSMIYLRLTNLAPTKDDHFPTAASEIFADLWSAGKAAKKVYLKSFDKLSLRVINRTVQRTLLERFMEWNFFLADTSLDPTCLDKKSYQDSVSTFMNVWRCYEIEDIFMQELHCTSLSFFDTYNNEYNPDGTKKPKIKKNRMRPNKLVLDTLEKEIKAQERRTCRMCKKKESHVANFITCSECIKTKFPKVAHYCSRLCEKRAWESFHDEHHVLFALEMDIPSEDEALIITN